MSENSNRFDKSSAAEFSDDVIRRFLLGRLLAEEQSVFEERFMIDDVLAPRVRLSECELADDYAFGLLKSAERELFEKKFLVSADRKQKLRVSSALRDRFGTTSVLAPGAPQARIDVFGKLRGLFAPHQPAWRFAFGVVTLLLLIGTVWLVVKEPRIREGIKQRILARHQPAARATREAAHPDNKSTPEHPISSSPMPAHDSTAPSPMIISVRLSPAASQKSLNISSVNLPKGERDIIRIQLAIEANQAGLYRIEVLTFGGRSVFSAELPKLPDSGAEIDFDLPAHSLTTGDYQVKLSRTKGRTIGSVTTYYFRAQ